eukprot:s3721_g4.t1
MGHSAVARPQFVIECTAQTLEKQGHVSGVPQKSEGTIANNCDILWLYGILIYLWAHPEATLRKNGHSGTTPTPARPDQLSYAKLPLRGLGRLKNGLVA